MSIKRSSIEEKFIFPLSKVHTITYWNWTKIVHHFVCKWSCLHARDIKFRLFDTDRQTQKCEAIKCRISREIKILNFYHVSGKQWRKMEIDRSKKIIFLTVLETTRFIINMLCSNQFIEQKIYDMFSVVRLCKYLTILWMQ